MHCYHHSKRDCGQVYLLNVVLMGVLVIIVVVSIYWLVCRTNKHRRVQVRTTG